MKCKLSRLFSTFIIASIAITNIAPIFCQDQPILKEFSISPYFKEQIITFNYLLKLEFI